MAVVSVTRPDSFIGLSSDTKPTSGVAYGSTFYETDTKYIYIFDGSYWNIM